MPWFRSSSFAENCCLICNYLLTGQMIVGHTSKQAVQAFTVENMGGAMTEVTRRIQLGAAACALATAAAFTPVAAQAVPDLAVPSTPMTQLFEPGMPLAPATLQNISTDSWFWFGPSNPNPPPRTNFFEFSPIAFVPGFLRPFFGWFSRLNFEICAFGLSVRLGPYGSVSASVGRGC